ncbi:hypothetical protein Taitung71_09360 [Helicobacter pylori]
MPTTPLNFFDNEELLPLDNVLEFLKIAIDEGVKKIRITGGEPLLRKGLDEFIAKLHAYNKEVALVLSTNGFLLKKMAKGLKNAGLSRVNVSLDSLKRVLKISQKDALKNTLEGIEESLKVGLKLKLNTVVVKSVNDDEILELLEYAKNRHIQIRVISRGVSRFVEHFNQLKGHQFFVKDSDMQDLHKQVSVVQNFSKQLNASGMSEESTIGGMFAGFGSLGISSFTTGAMLGGGLTMGGLAGMAVFGGLVAGPALAIFGAVSADEMEEKLEKAKAYYSQVEAAVKKADAIIDQFQAIEKMVKLFTRQIAKCDALLFLLSQDAIATMKEHNYDISLYSQEERDQLCVTVSTLMTLSAFLKVPIIDKHQKLQEKAQRALEIMKKQMDSLESGHYDVAMIQSRQQDLENLFKNGSPGGLKDKGF